MAGRLRVPEKRATNPNASREFPKGDWQWEIEEIRLREIDPKANPKLGWMFETNERGNRRYAGPTAETVSLQLGRATALNDGQEDPGDQKLFVEITLRDGDVYIDEVGENATEEQGVGYQIAIDGALYANLALALGQAYKQDGFVMPADDFRTQLVDGAFKGVNVAGRVIERTFKKRDGSTGSKVELEYFSPAS